MLITEDHNDLDAAAGGLGAKRLLFTKARGVHAAGIDATLLQVAVHGGGTLQRVNHPVAVELGRLMQTVAFVEPTIAWAERNDHAAIEKGLVTLASGLPIG